MEFKKIKEVAKINPENINKDYNKKHIMYLDTANITNGRINEIVKIDISNLPSRAKRIVKKNDIIYSTVRPNLCHYGILRNTVDNMIVSTGFTVIRCDNTKIIPEYLYAYITLPYITDKLHAIAETSTSAYPSIKPSDIENLIIPVPSIKIQSKVARILSNFDKKIELNNQINDNLFKQELDLYNEWFVNYNFPNSNGKYKKSELENIPYNWKVGYFGDNILTKIVKSGVECFDGEKEYLATADVDGTIINNSSIITYGNRPSRANMTPISNSIWFAKMENSKKNILIMDYMKDLIDSYIFSTGFMGIECINNSVNYLWCLINDKNFLNIKNNNSTGTLMAGLSNNTTKNIKYIIPDQATMFKFNEIVNPINKKIYYNNKENKVLEKLRDTLLPKLMNGEIDLDKIEI